MHCGSCVSRLGSPWWLYARSPLASARTPRSTASSMEPLRLPYDNASRMVAVENVYPQGSYFAQFVAGFSAVEESAEELHATGRDVQRFARTWTGAGEPQC